jgi:hypothetical protein
MGQVIYSVLSWFLFACKTFLYNVLIDPRRGNPLALNQDLNKETKCHFTSVAPSLAQF